LEFLSTYKITTLGRDLIRNIYAKFGVDPFGYSWEGIKMCQPIRG